jgi:hypothetical protein
MEKSTIEKYGEMSDELKTATIKLCNDNKVKNIFFDIFDVAVKQDVTSDNTFVMMVIFSSGTVYVIVRSSYNADETVKFHLIDVTLNSKAIQDKISLLKTADDDDIDRFVVYTFS